MFITLPTPSSSHFLIQAIIYWLTASLNATIHFYDTTRKGKRKIVMKVWTFSSIDFQLKFYRSESCLALAILSWRCRFAYDYSITLLRSFRESTIKFCGRILPSRCYVHHWSIRRKDHKPRISFPHQITIQGCMKSLLFPSLFINNFFISIRSPRVFAISMESHLCFDAPSN